MPVFGKPVVRKNGGLSIETMAESLMDEGYLNMDEHGKYDLHEFTSENVKKKPVFGQCENGQTEKMNKKTGGKST